MNCLRPQKLSVVMFDNKLEFDKHIENICLKANSKLSTPVRVTNYMALPKGQILINAFFKAQFNYCPFISMFRSCSLNNKINWLHKCCLCIIYNDKRSSFKELLVEDNSVSVHHNNIHTLTYEMYKVASGMSLEIMNNVFKWRDKTHYHLTHTAQFPVDPIYIVFNGSESASYLGPKI